jgi:hypothetical protein
MGLQQRQIAGSCAIAQSTVHEYLKAAAQAGVSWPLPAEWNEQQLEGLFPEASTWRAGPLGRRAGLPRHPQTTADPPQPHREISASLRTPG